MWNTVTLDFPVLDQLHQVTSTCGVYGVSSVHHTAHDFFFLEFLVIHLVHSAEKSSSLFSEVWSLPRGSILHPLARTLKINGGSHCSLSDEAGS